MAQVYFYHCLCFQSDLKNFEEGKVNKNGEGASIKNGGNKSNPSKQSKINQLSNPNITE
jgi:hypothetical protein